MDRLLRPACPSRFDRFVARSQDIVDMRVWPMNLPVVIGKLLRFASSVLRTIEAQSGNRFFAICLGFFVAVEVFVTLGPALHRVLPVEPDDALTYLLRTAQMVECPRQDCVALEDLRVQLSAVMDDPQLAAPVQEAYWHVFLNHVPGYSLTAAVLRTLGLSFFQTYNVLTILGGIAIAVGAAIWARALVGAWAGGIAVVLFALTYFVGHGLIWIVPSNMTLGMAMLAFGLLVERREQRGMIPFFLLVLMAAMLSWHSIGRFYAVALLLSYAALVRRPYVRVDWIFLTIGVGLVGASEALPYVIERPLLRMPIVPLPFEGTALDAVLANVREMPRIVARSAIATLGYGGLVAVVVIAALTLPRWRRWPFLLFLAGFGGLCAASLLHLSPRIPAEIFARFWVPLALLLSCAFAWVLLSAAKVAVPLMETYLAAGAAGPEKRGDSILREGLALLLLLGMLCGAMLHVIVGAYAIVRAERMVSARDDFAYFPDSVTLLRDSDGRCGRIFYSRKEVMFAHFLDGAMDCRVYWNPSGKRDLAGSGFADVRRVAFFNPVRHNQGWVDLAPSSGVVVDFERTPTGSPYLLLRGRGEVEWKLVDAKERTIAKDRIAIEEGPATWRQLDASAWRPQLRLILTTRTGRVEMGGIRIAGTAAVPADRNPVRWPWGEGVRMKYFPRVPHQDVPAADIAFDAALWANVSGRPLRVLDDRGFGVIATVQ
ncbi:hypothetical protein [Shumkonia mesophila]|uniref:hypothetical protein n=1 Tax=Shumkonia mesophila TaxID=2838854 RepID=UPI002934300E|nr:hypothetical protein [Shumkonia mesophila]